MFLMFESVDIYDEYEIARIILRERIFDTVGIDPHHDVSSMSWLLTIGQWGTNPFDLVHAVGNVNQCTI